MERIDFSVIESKRKKYFWQWTPLNAYILPFSVAVSLYLEPECICQQIHFFTLHVWPSRCTIFYSLFTRRSYVQNDSQLLYSIWFNKSM